jgi:cytochrome c
MRTRSAALAIACLSACLLRAQSPGYGVGRAAGDQDVRAFGVTVAPDGKGLPEGSGTAVEGRALFAQRCAKCHGEKAEGDVGPALVGGRGSLATVKPRKTVGSFWPYATTLWDYIHRAMPFHEPGSLSPSQAYAASAYILYLNEIVGEKDVVNAKTLPKIRMPNRDGFVADPRPDVKRK